MRDGAERAPGSARALAPTSVIRPCTTLSVANGYVLTQASLLLPAFILAEATMSYVGLGFPMETATWGTML